MANAGAIFRQRTRREDGYPWRPNQAIAFQPEERYPIVEQVYAGPHSAFVPKEFGRLPLQHEIAELGFIVVQIDGMGTNHRGKSFHDVCWKNLKDAVSLIVSHGFRPLPRRVPGWTRLAWGLWRQRRRTIGDASLDRSS